MPALLHLPHRRTASPAPDERSRGSGNRVFAVQRTGAVLLGLFLLAFGLLGFASGQRFFSTVGTPVLGMNSNGLLSAISAIVALVLLGAAARSPRTASTVMIIVGSLFLLSGTVNLFVLQTHLNLLAFEASNVIFSFVVGLLLLLIGAYGRLTGSVPPDSPYAHQGRTVDDYVDDLPHTPDELAAERAMRDAEVAVVQHTATPEQRRRVLAMAAAHTRADRRRVWMDLERTAASADVSDDVSGGGPRGAGRRARRPRLGRSTAVGHGSRRSGR
jgi:Domain of unknown function (DUF4383)